MRRRLSHSLLALLCLLATLAAATSHADTRTASTANQGTVTDDQPVGVEQARQAAIEAGAAETAADLLADGEKALSRARRYAARGRADKAAAAAAEALRLFRDAELVAIQNSVLGDARELIRRARAERAKRYAPRTLARAEQLLIEAADSLVRDRTNLEAATDLADEAEATAALALQIIRRARTKPSVEELILERAGDIWALQAAAGLPQRADQDRDQAVRQLVGEISRLRDSEARLREDLDDSRRFAAALEEEIRILDERLGGATAERRELVMQIERQERAREQLRQAQALFSPSEAEVFQQSDVIVARLSGLNFASGSAQLSDDSDTLFAKIGRLLAIYPNATLVIEGHTDSKGSDRLNQRLSELRARAVMERILRDNPIDPEKITAIGYGETRPIANNETAEGRAKNRRIDLLITPAD